jgi:hypothetical protein
MASYRDCFTYFYAMKVSVIMRVDLHSAVEKGYKKLENLHEEQ